MTRLTETLFALVVFVVLIVLNAVVDTFNRVR